MVGLNAKAWLGCVGFEDGRIKWAVRINRISKCPGNC
jgi:hypothetical protein